MIDRDTLEDILDVLREKGATHFSCSEFSVTLGAAPVEAAEESIDEAIRVASEAERLPSAARGIFGHPSLWANGRPPQFPGAERATQQHKPTHPDDEI